MTVILQHETDTTTALEIMRTRRFIAGPILGDAGLNACIVGHHRGKYHADQAERPGAILESECSGPVSAEPYSFLPERNVCYDQYPHRAFIFVGTTQHLRLVGPTPLNGWSDCVLLPDLTLRTIGPWCLSQMGAWTKRQACKIADEVKQTLAQKPPVQIVLPRTAPYLPLVRERFPDIE